MSDEMDNMHTTTSDINEVRLYLDEVRNSGKTPTQALGFLLDVAALICVEYIDETFEAAVSFNANFNSAVRDYYNQARTKN